MQFQSKSGHSVAPMPNRLEKYASRFPFAAAPGQDWCAIFMLDDVLRRFIVLGSMHVANMKICVNKQNVFLLELYECHGVVVARLSATTIR